MSNFLKFRSSLIVATSALGFARSHASLALKCEPSLLLLEAAVADAETALTYLKHAAGFLEESGQKTNTLAAS